MHRLFMSSQILRKECNNLTVCLYHCGTFTEKPMAADGDNLIFPQMSKLERQDTNQGHD